MSDLLRSIIRTGVPALIGAVVAWFADRGINIDNGTVTLAVAWLSFVAYYGVARLVEAIEPKAGWLLGAPGAPVYGD